MKPFNTFLVAAFVSAAVLVPNMAQEAMPIQVYDRMSANDQADYTARILVGGAKQVLTDAGRPDQAAQVEKLFTTIEPGDEISLGMVELELNMSVVRQTDADNLVKNSNAKPVKVEIAMIVTLKKNGIILPKIFMHVGDTFDPKDPLSPPPQFGSFSQCVAFRHGACATTPPAAAPSAEPAAVPPPAAAPASPPASTPDDDPIGAGGFITPPDQGYVVLCVQSGLIQLDHDSWNTPDIGDKMVTFQNFIGPYILSVAKPNWLYGIGDQAYARFNPATTADPASFVSPIPPGQQATPGSCPADYSAFWLWRNPFKITIPQP